jgi:hypothetical protein
MYQTGVLHHSSDLLPSPAVAVALKTLLATIHHYLTVVDLTEQFVALNKCTVALGVRHDHHIETASHHQMDPDSANPESTNPHIAAFPQVNDKKGPPRTK